MTAMNKFYQDSFYNQKMKKDYFEDVILDKTLLNDVLKFHQSTTFYGYNYYTANENDELLLTWMKSTEYTDVLPNFVIEEVTFDEIPLKRKASMRDFDKEYCMAKSKFGHLLNEAFGRDDTSFSKRYPSAGALYPVFPIIYIFSPDAAEGLSMGCYVFDSHKIRLLKIKDFSSKDTASIRSAISNDDFPSYLAIGYAIDLKRAVTKYRRRGYRHALIEVGLMAQSFREACRDVDDELGELCWSGFSDHQLAHASGLNPRLSPIGLLQWFGRKHDKHDI